jgi:hypothetical protein
MCMSVQDFFAKDIFPFQIVITHYKNNDKVNTETNTQLLKIVDTILFFVCYNCFFMFWLVQVGAMCFLVLLWHM